MRWKSGLACLLMIGGGTSASAQEPVVRPTVEELSPQIDGLFADYQAQAHIPGMIYGVIRDGRLVYVRGIGVQDLTEKRPVTTETRFRIASMTKAFTALAILQLRDEGKLRLDDLAESYIPEMKGWTYPTADSPRIRVRDLLQHVGGLVTDDPWGDRQQALPHDAFARMIAAGVPFSRAPQTGFEYSNFGYALLGRIVASASGMPYSAYVTRRILTPLGMAATTFEVSEVPRERLAIGYRWENEAWSEEPEMRDGAFGAMGGLVTTADDYAKWVGFLLSAWPPRDGEDAGPVLRASVREMAQGLNFMTVSNRIGSSGATACKQAAAYGMGWRVAQDCDLGLTLAHGGGYPGYGSHVMLMPDRGVGVFALANRTYSGPSAPAWDTAVLLDREGLLEARPVPVSTVVADMFGAVQAAYAAGDLSPLDGRLAVNFLMDRSAENWAAELARLKAEVGSCTAESALTATGALSATFRLDCERGKLDGGLLLAPTTPATIQALRLRVVPPPAG
ncbi:MAG: serine hydrolase domain-containing protein [Sphingopyxis sp.]|uniref:serine hydrolase domain-containing protein n=1 Tax=Sphingopyxis sp. TaxID=1908224 RepID=UPI002ABC983D|nr:serine hydrolase domain-containing protein [Sphingopyxis sp.]MDZ3832481.1 serine hydrolase domain-containing protein [Sphingopyxis sp.]